MNKRIKTLWIKALKSGKYKQCKDAMRKRRGKTTSYCCLGVLEQLRCDETGAKFQDCGVLSPDTMAWAGLDSDDPMLAGRRNPDYYAARLNDKGETFDYIANRIEKYL
jgi:hypothetical protein